MMNRCVFGSCTVLLCGGVALADSVSLQPVADNTLFESPTGSLSNGAGTAFFAGRNSAGTNSIRRGLLRFDLAGSIPAGATIQSVELTLVNSGSNDAPQAMPLHRVLESWGEGTSVAGSAGGGGGGAPATPGDATWIHRSFNTQNWSTAGGVFDSVISTTTSVGAAGTYTWSSSPRFVSDAQSFLDSPAINFGWLVRGNESAASTAKRFSTREEADTSLRPVLRVTYVVPSPGTVGLAALSLLGVRRRR